MSIVRRFCYLVIFKEGLSRVLVQVHILNGTNFPHIGPEGTAGTNSTSDTFFLWPVLQVCEIVLGLLSLSLSFSSCSGARPLGTEAVHGLEREREDNQRESHRGRESDTLLIATTVTISRWVNERREREYSKRFLWP